MKASKFLIIFHQLVNLHLVNVLKVEIPTDSELQIIDRGAFEQTSIENIIIPSQVEFIGENSFDRCNQLKIIEITSDSQLQSIERGTFPYTSVERISIPPKIFINIL